MNMMKWSTLISTLLILLSSLSSCSRKPAQTAPPPPEVLVTTVKPQDVPRVLERVATLGRFHQRQHQRAGAGLHRFARLPGGRRGKKGRPSFPDRFPAVRSRIGAGQGNSGKRQSQPGESRRGRKTRDATCSTKKSSATRSAILPSPPPEAGRANIEADEAAVKQAELNLGYTRVISPIDGVAAIANSAGGRSCRTQHRNR